MSERSVRGRIKRMVPPIARRDDQLAQQAAELRALTKQLRRAKARAEGSEARAARSENSLAEIRAKLEASAAALERPSFQRALVDLRRTVVSLRDIDPDKRHPLRQLPVKLANYRLAASHGIAVPQVYARWSAVSDINVSGLPDEFVLKSDRGAGAHGVFPLSRNADATFAIVNTDRALDLHSIKAEFASRESLTGPYFAEELLKDADGRRIPNDVKVYAFYGKIGQVFLRRADEHGNLRRTYGKFIDENGQDLGDAVSDRNLDPTIPVPEELAAITAASRHLSRAIGVPFVRVDLYVSDRGVVLGELTRAPGTNPAYSVEHDTLMGRLLEDARWRLERDLMLGRPPGILHGPHRAPQDGRDASAHHRPQAERVDCAMWCREA